MTLFCPGREGWQAGHELVRVSRELAALAHNLNLNRVCLQRHVLGQEHVHEPDLRVNVGRQHAHSLVALSIARDQKDVDTGLGSLDGLGDRPANSVRCAQDQVALGGLVGQYDLLGLLDCLCLLLLEQELILLDFLLVVRGGRSSLRNLIVLLGIDADIFDQDDALDEGSAHNGRGTALEDGEEKRISTGLELGPQVDEGRAEAGGDVAAEEDGLLFGVVEEGNVHSRALGHLSGIPAHLGKRVDQPESVHLGGVDGEAEEGWF